MNQSGDKKCGAFLPGADPARCVWCGVKAEEHDLSVVPSSAATGETPRTDAIANRYGIPIGTGESEYRDLARQLERELAEAKATSANLAKAYVAEREVLLRYKSEAESLRSSISELRDLTAYIDELEKRAAEQKEWEKHPKCEDNGVGDTMQVIANELRDKFAVSARSETHRYVYIYPNGDYTAGRMEAIKLIPEIVYNVRMRPGRAIVVDGVAVYEGINVATDLIDSIISNLDGTTKP